MSTHFQAIEEIRRVTHSAVDKHQWAEHLLARVQSVIRARGQDRSRELRQLELAIRIEIDDARVIKPLYQFIWDNTEWLRVKITELHIDLSDNELFLCACIYLGISMTDVAVIKGVTPATINMNRYRLKKKLVLPADIDLEMYLHHFLHKLNRR